MSAKKLVLMDHDGGVDDLISLVLLLTMPHVELIGVSITPADCYLDFALETTCKILDMLGADNIPVAKGALHGVNAFPPEWRAAPHIINALPIMLERETSYDKVVEEPAHTFIANQLRSAPQPLTILLTGPASNLAKALQDDPTLRANIKEVVWMAGAVNVTGNVRTYNHDGSAEWNVFWDPPAGKTLMEAKLPLTIFPLDATNHVPVNMTFLQQLAQQRSYPLSDFVGQCWATTINTIPHIDYQYFMWDTLATGYLGRPELINFHQLELTVATETPNAGKTIQASGSGQWVNIAGKVDVEAFYTYLLTQFRQ